MRKREDWRAPTYWFEQWQFRRASDELAKPLLERRLCCVLNFYPCKTWPLNWVLPCRLRNMTIGEVINLNDRELLAMKGVGSKTLIELKARFNSFSVSK